MFERFTERARQVVVLAQEEARGFQHDYIGAEHILLGLMREEEGLGAKVLIDRGLTEERVRRAIGSTKGRGTTKPEAGKQIPFTPEAKKVFELSLREALSLGHNYIGTEHILLGLNRDAGWARGVLGPDEEIRDAVIAALSGPTRPKDRPPRQARAKLPPQKPEVTAGEALRVSPGRAQRPSRSPRLGDRQRSQSHRRRPLVIGTKDNPNFDHDGGLCSAYFIWGGMFGPVDTPCDPERPCEPNDHICKNHK